MKFFVCGGTGYVGSKVVKQLVQSGHDVCCVKRDNSNIEHLTGTDVMFCGDSLAEVERALEKTNYDWVINFACAYGSKTNLYNDILEANIIFPLRVLNMATNYGVKKFLTIGTGLPDSFNMYSFSKTVYAEFGEYYSQHCGIDFFNVELEMYYGPNEPNTRFLPQVIEKLSRNERVPLTLGTQKRDIIYIDDVVKGIIFIINCKELKGYIDIPLGTGMAPSIKEIVVYLRDALQSKSQLDFGVVPMRDNEPDSVADVSLLAERGYKVNYHWEAGLMKLLEKEGLVIAGTE